ncbi:M57 family metalloprotease [Nocardioides jiangxiensis]|uniref:M57 family metalloprotease n=1 Tax=Nocardioides jiangxiensis TaxID=3064524 RepID=A0ABT9B334_9ACTN|nr:M57 family metalloprotease [Nocardioides sp. WY-20]MDO7868022.1 M57 family metalloprotease [Nocardioides sp. WY-20]
MSLTRKWKLTLAATLGTTAIAGTAYAADVPSWQQFEAATYTDPTGVRVVNGDEAMATTGDLHKFYDELTSTPKKGLDDGLIVNTVNGADDKWSASQVGNLTYCVSDKFGADKAGIVAAMNGGAALWESASSAIDFVYVPSQDASCTTRNTSVLFSVEPVQTSQYIARSFFPSTPKRSRNVLVDDSIWSSGSWTPSNILGHELGHVLGFRHEHTRPEAGTCFEDNNWRPLTPYDSVSIMHYPQCNGGSTNLQFSSLDAQGVAALYGN